LGKGQDTSNADVLKQYSWEIATAAQKIQKEMIPRTHLLHAYARVGALFSYHEQMLTNFKFGAIVFLDPHWDWSSFKNKMFAPAAHQEVMKVFKTIPTDNNEEHPLALGNFGAEWAIIHIVSALNPEQGAQSPAAHFMRNCLAELRTASMTYT
jgi:hypothetical protein